jgi:hypothetical protein
MADMFDKEELSIVSGLFPNTLAIAEAEKLGQQEAAYKRFSGAAGTQNPFAGLAGLSGMFGTAAGQELRGLTGVQSPTMQLVSLRDRAAKQFDTSTPEGLVQMAQFLNQQGDAAGARQAIMVAQGQNRRGLEAEKLQGEIGIQGREIKEIGVANNPDLLQKAVVDKTGRIIARVGDPYNRFSQKTTIDARQIGPKNVLEIDKKDAEELLKNRNSLEKSIPLLENSIVQLDKGIIGGTFSDARTALANALSSAGLKDPKITQYLASTKTFNANRIELATAIAKQLGVNPTDRDFQASLDRFAAASENPASSKLFLTEMVALKKQQLVDTNNALNFYRKNEGSFEGYDRPLPRAVSGGGDLSGMSTDQLRLEINKLKKPSPKQ